MIRRQAEQAVAAEVRCTDTALETGSPRRPRAPPAASYSVWMAPFSQIVRSTWPLR